MDAMCLRCETLPATKLEDKRGFALCDVCYFTVDLPSLELPRQTVQDRLIAVQTAEILRLTRELEQSRNVLCGGG